MSKALALMLAGFAIAALPVVFTHRLGPVPFFAGIGAFVVGFIIYAAQKEGANEKAIASTYDGFAYWFEHSGDGIAISPERRILRVQKGGLTGNIVKEYAFEDVRRWHTNKATGGEIAVAVGMQAGFQALGHNVRNASKNRRESGFYVCVRDIDNPEWRINMQNVADQKKWMEILEQHINEGRMAPAHRDVDAIAKQ